MTDKEFAIIYDDYCENFNELAGKKVLEASKNFNLALDKYIAEVSEDSFCKGFRHAMRLLNKE